MAFPTILINATGGTDTQASGAGPATALFGTTDASTDGAGTTVTLTAGTDLSGVAIDGSAVIFLNNTTAGARNFAKITNSGGSGGATPTVTVAEAFAINLTTKSWAIGGKRATIGTGTSLRLFDNNGASGDAMPGWIMEMQSGHTETTAAINCRRAGDTTSGPIILRGTSGAATLPIVTFNVNAASFIPRGSYWQFRGFEVQNSNGTKTASVAFAVTTCNNVSVDGIKCIDGTNKFWKFYTQTQGRNTVTNCRVENCANSAIVTTVGVLTVQDCYVKSSGFHGIDISGDLLGVVITGNIVAATTGDGIHVDGSTLTTGRSVIIQGNTIDSNTGDGIEFLDVMSDFMQGYLANNILSNNGGAPVNFSGASVTAVGLGAIGFVMTNNDCFGNGTDTVPAGLSTNDPAVDPAFTNAAGGNYAVGSALASLGWPTTAIGLSSTLSYVDIGAAQRQPATASSESVAIFGG